MADLRSSIPASPSSTKKEMLSQKNRLLDSTLLEFSKTTKELSDLEQKLTQLRMNTTPRKSAPLPSSSELANTTSSKPAYIARNTIIDTSSPSASTLRSITIALDESSAELDVHLEALRIDLETLRKKEALAGQQHSASRTALQDSWDKLVGLRGHICSFRASIDEAKQDENEGNSGSVSGVSRGVEKGGAALRSSIQARVTMAEQHLGDLQAKLAEHSAQLSATASLSASSAALTMSTSSPAYTKRDVTVTMTIRKALLELAGELQKAEADYMVSLAQLEACDANQSNVSSPAGAGTGVSTIPDTHTTLASTAYTTSPSEDNDEMYSSSSLPPIRCEFSLHEVLAGAARVVRLNGEASSSYRMRLERRLVGLLVLENELVEEIEVQAGVVRHHRDRIRELEVTRLRLELTMANTEGRQRQLEVEALRVPLEGVYTSISAPHTPSTHSSQTGTAALPAIARSQHLEATRLLIHDLAGAEIAATIGDVVKAEQEAVDEIGRSDELDCVSASDPTPLSDTGTESQGKETCAPTQPEPAAPAVDERNSYSYWSVQPPSTHAHVSPSHTFDAVVGNGTAHLSAAGGAGKIGTRTHAVNDIVLRLSSTAAQMEALPTPTITGALQSPSIPKKSAIYAARGLLHTLERQQEEIEHLKKMYENAKKAGEENLKEREAHIQREIQKRVVPFMKARPVSSTATPMSVIDGKKMRSKSAESVHAEQSPSQPTPASKHTLGFGSSSSKNAVAVVKDSIPTPNPTPLPKPRTRSASTSPTRQKSTTPIRGRPLPPHTPSIKPLSTPATASTTQPLPPSKRESLGDIIEEAIGSPLRARIQTGTIASSPLAKYPVPEPRGGGVSLASLPPSIASTVTSILSHSSPLVALSALKQKIDLNKLRYEAAARSELLSPLGIAVNHQKESLGLLQLTVLSASCLPPVKRISQSCDAYVEMLLLTPSSSTDASTSALPMQVTGIVENTLYPQWREGFTFAPVVDPTSYVLLTIKDRVKIGLLPDEPVAYCTLPLSHLLDQSTHRLTLQLRLPEQSSHRPRTWGKKLSSDCMLRVEARFFYSKQSLYLKRVMELEDAYRVCASQIGPVSAIPVVRSVDSKSVNDERVEVPSSSGSSANPSAHSGTGAGTEEVKNDTPLPLHPALPEQLLPPEGASFTTTRQQRIHARTLATQSHSAATHTPIAAPKRSASFPRPAPRILGLRERQPEPLRVARSHSVPPNRNTAMVPVSSVAAAIPTIRPTVARPSSAPTPISAPKFTVTPRPPGATGSAAQMAKRAKEREKEGTSPSSTRGRALARNPIPYSSQPPSTAAAPSAASAPVKPTSLPPNLLKIFRGAGAKIPPVPIRQVQKLAREASRSTGGMRDTGRGRGSGSRSPTKRRIAVPDDETY